MIEQYSTLAAPLEAFSRVLSTQGIDARTVFERAGLDALPYRDPDSRLGLPVMKRLWEACEGASKDPCFAFEAGMAIVPANFHALGFAWLASRNIRGALERLSRYHRLVSTAVEIQIEERGDELYVHFGVPPVWPQQGLDVAVTAVVAMCRDIADPEYKPVRVDMTRKEPECTQRLADYFQCPICFQAQKTGLAFSLEEAERLLPRQNPALARANDEVAQRYIAQMDHDDVLSRAQIELIDMLSNGEPSRAALAQRLHLSERTLARRLSERSVSFRVLLDAVRRELALGYIDQMKYAVTDIAYLLGFSDQSNFTRSFRRWTGVAPSHYRRSRRAVLSGEPTAATPT